MNIVYDENVTVVSLKRPKIHCGDVAACPRKAVLHLSIDAKCISETNMISDLYMAIGTAIHGVITSHLKMAGILLESEMHLSEDKIGPPKYQPLGGYVDAVAMIKGEISIIEIKTCGSLPSKPKFWHQMQTAAYMVLTGIDSAYIQYVSRKVAQYKTVLQSSFKIDEELIGYAARNMASAHVHANNGSLPPIPDYFVERWKCEYCPFIPFCWNGDNMGMKFRRHSAKVEFAIEKLTQELLDARKDNFQQLRTRYKERET